MISNKKHSTNMLTKFRQLLLQDVNLLDMLIGKTVKTYWKKLSKVTPYIHNHHLSLIALQNTRICDKYSTMKSKKRRNKLKKEEYVG